MCVNLIDTNKKVLSRTESHNTSLGFLCNANDLITKPFIWFFRFLCDLRNHICENVCSSEFYEVGQGKYSLHYDRLSVQN